MLTTVPIDSAAALGTLIRQTRTAAKLRQADAAVLCGVSVPFLNQIERGKATAQFDRVLKVCKGLGIRLFADAPAQSDAL